MATKKIKLDSASEVVLPETDWTLCVLCQKRSSEPLRDPSKSKDAHQSRGYDTIAEHIQELHSLGALPLDITLSRLDDGQGIAVTLSQHNARWHKTCHMKFTQEKVERARKKISKVRETETSPLKGRLRGAFPGSSSKIDKSLYCFFCDDRVEKGYHRAATAQIDANVRKMATELRDTRLLAKLSSGDMTAIDAVYHKQCLTAFCNRHRTFVRKEDQKEYPDVTPESIAFAELVSYIEESRQEKQHTEHIFKLSNLVRLYRSRLQQLDSDVPERTNSTRLKEKLLAQIPDLEAHKNKYEVMLTFKDDVGETLLEAKQRACESDAVVLMRAANIIRNDIFQKRYTFTGSLTDKQYDDNTASLLALVKMVLGGTNIQNQMENNHVVKTAAISIAELITFNTVKSSRRKATAQTTRHSLERETRLPLYMGLLIHSKTRKRDLIDTLFEKGLSVSYDRVQQIATDVANSALASFEDVGVVYPRALRKDLFTTGNLDNIDHNPSSTSVRTAFHGTAISLTQHVTNECAGTELQKTPLIYENMPRTRKMKPILESYITVPPAAFPDDSPPPHKTEGQAVPGMSPVDSDHMQLAWASSVENLLKKPELNADDDISWSAHFAASQDSCPRPPAISGLMPLFRENAHSLAMVKHGMDVIAQATELVHPGQVPILTVDQPLFVLAKKIQWTWPETYGKDKFVVMMGGLHIEMAFLKVLGEWIDGSGWVSVMKTANVTTDGRGDALTKGSFTARSQWAHQVTAAALFCLRNQAYNSYKVEVESEANPAMPFNDWCTLMETQHPQFRYWSKTFNLEVLFLQFMQSQREGNFELYISTLGRIVPWMFAMDHFHYAKWLPVHVRDLMQLQHECPTVYQEFREGKFVTQKTTHCFSMMAHDHVHEQLNAVLKGDGGIIGITENESALKRWLIAGPEMARIIHDVEVTLSQKETHDNRHHEQTLTTQKRFASNVQSVIDVMNELGNPFTETSNDLLTLDTKVIMADEVVKNISEAEEIGKNQYKTFVELRLVKMEKPLYETVPKNNLQLFKYGERKVPSKMKSKLSNMKSDLQLFSRMYISCQARNGDMDVFFQHENHSWPPSLAENNMMRLGEKADLLKCLEPLAQRPQNTPDVDVKIFDGAALVHTLDPKTATTSVKTFKDYAECVFLPYLKRQLVHVTRVDVVWDAYKADSLKAHTREGRGTGEALRVSDKTRLPHNWKSFLRVDRNKTELFRFLATVIESESTVRGKMLVTTKGQSVASSATLDASGLQPCSHEEADYRMMLHCFHAYRSGMKRIMVHATDTDVLVLAIVTTSKMEDCEIWLAFGHGAHFRYIGAHAIASELGNDYCRGLPFMHAFSGCDTVSSLSSVGKKTAWEVWKSLPEITEVFQRLSTTPDEVTDADLKELERYVVLLYSRTSQLTDVNEARKHLFSYCNRNLENIPPSRAALLQHVKRAAYQAGYVWGQTLEANPTLPSPSEWGWKLDSERIWVPLWSTLPEASKGCRELITCACKKRCTGRCQCAKASLPCTQLCFCGGQCADKANSVLD